MHSNMDRHDLHMYESVSASASIFLKIQTFYIKQSSNTIKCQ